ncbi:DUF3330 domain-containing protein, partial [Salmonella enterica subsp. enterica serovar Hadar]|nr:DUF3330 domain-containing protein [Salmonella enterica subsp. enterica serovar Hadar]
KMPAFEWVHVQLHQQKGMISLSPPTICNSAAWTTKLRCGKRSVCWSWILAAAPPIVPCC